MNGLRLGIVKHRRSKSSSLSTIDNIPQASKEMPQCLRDISADERNGLTSNNLEAAVKFVERVPCVQQRLTQPSVNQGAAKRFLVHCSYNAISYPSLPEHAQL